MNLFFKNSILNLFTFCFFVNFSFGQLTIEFPSSRSVFQRDNSNKGYILITGLLGTDADRVEARVLPRDQNQGLATDWIIIDNNIAARSFTGKIQGQGGWYNLEVRSIKDGTISEVSLKERIGIGEVFVIAGQSNAQGEGSSPNSIAAKDDRVNAYNESYFDYSPYVYREVPEILSKSNFTQLSKNINIGPYGYTSWCYGELGDYLASRLNVPIMFYNAAQSSTSSTNWVQSIIGENTSSGSTLSYTRFSPYNTLRKTLQNEIAIFGLRSILWHQGESDFNTSKDQYVANLKVIINQTRTNTSQKIPWVISRASRGIGGVKSQIIEAQNALLNANDLIFQGPATDDIQPIRVDGVHFKNDNLVQGLSQLAVAWDLSLNTAFFSNATPILPKDIVKTGHSCISQTSISLAFDNAYSQYSWTSGSTASNLIVNPSSTIYFANLKDVSGNWVFSSIIVPQNVFPKVTPSIIAPNGILACVGKNVELEIIPSKFKTIWNTGATTPKVSSTTSLPYFTRHITDQGCYSSNSNVITPAFVNPPATPTVSITNNDGYVCKGEEVRVSVNNPSGHEVLWSNGLKTQNISIKENPTSPLTVILKSNFDCPSPVSNVIDVNFVPVPENPKIAYLGPYYLAASSNIPVSGYEWYLNNTKLNGLSTESIMNKGDGFYSVKAYQTFKTPAGRTINCSSGISTIIDYKKIEAFNGMLVYPNPSTDGIFYLTSETEKKNVQVRVFSGLGALISESTIDRLSAPVKFSLGNRMDRCYFEVTHENEVRVFTVLFR